MSASWGRCEKLVCEGIVSSHRIMVKDMLSVATNSFDMLVTALLQLNMNSLDHTNTCSA